MQGLGFRMFRKEGLALGRCGLHRDLELILTLGALLSRVLITRTFFSPNQHASFQNWMPHMYSRVYIYIYIIYTHI